LSVLRYAEMTSASVGETLQLGCDSCQCDGHGRVNCTLLSGKTRKKGKTQLIATNQVLIVADPTFHSWGCFNVGYRGKQSNIFL